MGSTISTTVEDIAEETNRIVISKLYSEMAQHESTCYHMKCERNEFENKFKQLQLKHVQTIKENDILKTQVQRLQNGIRLGDVRCSDLLRQIDILHQENKTFKQRVVNLSSINCTFEQQIETYRLTIEKLRESIDFTNKCLQEKERVK